MAKHSCNVWKFFARIIFIFLVLQPVRNIFAAEDLTRITNAGGTVYFAHDFESNIFHADQGNGSFGAAGGKITGLAGSTGCDDTSIYHNAVISSDTAAFGSNSLKTPYAGACPNEAFQRDTTIINTPALSEGYIRWYQKWSGDWNSASVQQKFAKFYDGTIAGSGAPLVQFTFSSHSKIWRAYMQNIENHFNKDGTSANAVWVYATAAGRTCDKSYCSWDDYQNGVGGNDGEFSFDVNKWYEIEMHWKINSDANTADGLLEAWVDGQKIFSVSNYKFFNVGARPFLNTFELQHIYYDRSLNDQPTYMDNIVIADRHVGSATQLPASYADLDFMNLISSWLRVGTVFDLNSDNITNSKDLGMMMSKWN